MRAYILPSFDDAPRLEVIDDPVPAVDEVLIRILASSANPVDRMIAQGGFRELYEHRFPATMGRDFAGVVLGTGAEVTRFAVGDPVFGFVKRDHVGGGTFADLVVVPEQQFAVRLPPNVSMATGGVLGLSAVTALQCLDELACGPGSAMLINGATGGVGAFAIQLAKQLDLQVVATARPGAETAHVRDLGADHTVDWSTEDVAAGARGAYPEGVDGVIDLISRTSASMEALAVAALRPGGTSVSTLSAAPPPSGRNIRMANIHSSADIDLLQRVAQAASDGLVVPIVDTFPLEHIEGAFDALGKGPLGKVAVTMA